MESNIHIRNFDSSRNAYGIILGRGEKTRKPHLGDKDAILGIERIKAARNRLRINVSS
jgi:hypothetical protein